MASTMMANQLVDMDPTGGHHLLKHTAPSMQRVVQCFDGAMPKDIARIVARMGQRELQAKFNAVYNTVTRSNNNEWLRRKLFEAIGLKTACKGKSNPKVAPRRIKVGSDVTKKPCGIKKAFLERSARRDESRQTLTREPAQYVDTFQRTSSNSDESPQSSSHTQNNCWSLQQGPNNMLPANNMVLSNQGPQGNSYTGSICYMDQSQLQSGHYMQPTAMGTKYSVPTYSSSAAYPVAGGPVMCYEMPQGVTPIDCSRYYSDMQNSFISMQSPQSCNTLTMEPSSMSASDLMMMQPLHPAPSTLASQRSVDHSLLERSSSEFSEALLHRDILPATPSPQWNDEALSADVMELLMPKARTPQEAAIDDVMDEAIDSFIESAYSSDFPELVVDLTKTMTRLSNGLVKWHHQCESARRNPSL